MTISKTAPKKIMNYINQYDTTPLMFSGFTVRFPRKFLVSADLDNLVLGVIYTTHYFSSVNFETGIRETGSGRNRSSLDIWRHCKYFKPEVTIFEVMDSMWRQQDKLKSQYCWQVQRRVFNSLEAIYGAGRLVEVWHHSHRSIGDEYKIRFSTWGKLVEHAEVENV